MSRLEKKCLVTSAGVHALLFALLFAAPLLWVSNTRPISMRPLTVIPTKLIDGAMHGGGSPTARSAPAPAPANPAPAPVVLAPPPPPKPQPTPRVEEPPKPIETPAQAEPRSRKPKLTEKNLRTPKPELLDDTEVTSSRQKIKIDLTHRATPSQWNDARARARASEARANEARAAQERYAQQITSIVGELSKSVSPGTSIEVPGPGGEAFADYSQFVELVYRQNWVPPSTATEDSSTVEATIVVLRSGRVESFEVTRRSGQAALDRSVESLKRKVTFIAKFPEGATQERRTFVIVFDLRSKRPF